MDAFVIRKKRKVESKTSNSPVKNIDQSIKFQPKRQKICEPKIFDPTKVLNFIKLNIFFY